MSEMIQQCRSCIQGLYEEQLGQTLSDNLGDLAAAKHPVWQSISIADFTTYVTPDQPCAGLLLDPQIGIMLLILPFDKSTDINDQMVRALALRSRLLPESYYTGGNDINADRFGAWRIVLHWIVIGKELKELWLTRMIDVRRKTSSTEEVSVDAIFLPAKDQATVLAAHRFPRLLLTTRELLSKARMADSMQWLSANARVRAALKNFPEEFVDIEQQKLAEAVLKQMADYTENSQDGSSEPSGGPRILRSLQLKHFRNLRAHLKIHDRAFRPACGA